jgi:hypothetical protein
MLAVFILSEGDNMAYVSGKNFNNSGKKKQVNPILPLLLIIVMAVLLIALSSFVADVNSSMYQQQKELQSMYDEQNSGN